MADNGSLSCGILVELTDLVLVALKPGLHVGGDVSGIEAAAHSIAQDGGGAIIATHHDKAFLLAHIKYIVTGSSLCLLHLQRGFGCLEHPAFRHLRMARHKLTCFLFGLLLSNRCRHQHQRQQEQTNG